jgi:hypothetical protein
MSRAHSATTIRQPRCFLVYALAPPELSASAANQAFNAFVADRKLPLALFHDHFIGQPGGIAIFQVSNEKERDALLADKALAGWQVDIQPLIFSRSPAAFDEQIAFTLRAYREADWESLQNEERPSYGNPRLEAESATEDLDNKESA